MFVVPPSGGNQIDSLISFIEQKMYAWRKMTIEQQKEALKARKEQGLPWHSPPHFTSESVLYHLVALRA